LAVGVADRVAMMRYSVFSVISPEGCAAILWNDPSKQENATKAMKITSDDLLNLNLIDAIIDEPLVGGHRDKEGAIRALGDYFIRSLEEMDKQTQQERLDQRYARILSHGAYEER
jgi:acetyl-CoA carboxylase carboxyl transferase subunit alpha